LTNAGLADGDIVAIAPGIDPTLATNYITLARPNLTVRGTSSYSVGAAVQALDPSAATLASEVNAIVNAAGAASGLNRVTQTTAGVNGQTFRGIDSAANGFVLQNLYFVVPNNSTYSYTSNHNLGAVALYSTATAALPYSSIINEVSNSVFANISTQLPSGKELDGLALATMVFGSSDSPTVRSEITAIKDSVFDTIQGTVTNSWLVGGVVSAHAASTGTVQGKNITTAIGTIENSVFNNITAKQTSTNTAHYLAGGVVGVNSDYGNSQIGTIRGTYFNNISASTNNTLMLAGGAVYAGFYGSGGQASDIRIDTVTDSHFTNFTVEGGTIYGGAVAAHANYAIDTGDKLTINTIRNTEFDHITVTATKDLFGGAVAAAVATNTSSVGTATINTVDASHFSNNTVTSLLGNIYGGLVAARTYNGSATLDTVSDSSFFNNTASAINIYGGMLAAVNAANAASNAKATIASMADTIFENNDITATTGIYGGLISARNNTTLANAAIGSITDTQFSGIIATAPTIRGGLIYSSGTIDTLSGLSFDNIAVNNGVDIGVQGSLVYAGGSIGNLRDIVIDIATLPKNAAAVYATGNVTIDGTLELKNFLTAADLTPGSLSRASTLPATANTQTFTVVESATGTINGDFTMAGGTYASPYDFIVVRNAVIGGKTPNNKKYMATGTGSLDLAWTAGGDQAGTGTFTIDAGSSADNFNVDVALTDQNGTFASGWDGTSLTKMGTGSLTLSALNSYSGGTVVAEGTMNIGQVGLGNATTSQDNLSLGSVAIQNGAILNVRTQGGYAFNNALTGTGLLDVDNGGTANTFSFAGTVGSAFDGTVSLANNAFTLAGDNTAALTNATLRLGAGNATRVGTFTTSEPDQRIGQLEIDGGELLFNASIGDYQAKGIIRTQSLALDEGEVAVTLAAFNRPDVTDIDAVYLLEQDNGKHLTQLIAADKVTGTVSDIKLVDATMQTEIITADPTVVQIIQNGGTVATGIYDVGLTTTRADTSAPNGLYINYLLKELELLTHGDNALVLRPQAGATGSDRDLEARLTGSGDLIIAAGSGEVTLSNGNNDYTGKTTVQSGTLRFLVDNVLGDTSGLALAQGTTVDMDGYSQTVGLLESLGDETSVRLGSGTLTLRQGGLFNGTVSGDGGMLAQLDGTLRLTGNNTYTGGTTVAAGTLEVGGGAALGSGDLSMGTDTTLRALTRDTRLGNAIHLAGNVTVDTPDDATLLLAGEVDGSDTRIVKTGSGLLALSGHLNDITGANVDGGTLVVGTDASGSTQVQGPVNIAEGAILSGMGSVGDTINHGAIFAYNALDPSVPTGNLTLGALANHGLLYLAGSTPGNTLTIRGGMTAFSGSLLTINSILGSDSSPTDSLILDGGAISGTTLVDVRVAGDQGRQTGDGIRIVETRNGATTGPEDFELAHPVTSGAFNYMLRRGGSSSPDDWFLSKYWDDTPYKVDYRKEVSLLVGSLAGSAMEFGQAEVGTLQQRMGDPAVLRDDTERHLWGRSIAQGEWRGSNEGIYGENVQWDNTVSAFQMGSDLWVRAGEHHRTSLGLLYTMGRSKADVRHTAASGLVADAGETTMDAQGVGLHLTHLDASGAYADLVTQATLYDARIRPVNDRAYAQRGIGATASLELGWTLGWPTVDIRLEPQLQAIYQYIDFNDLILAPGPWQDSPTTVRFDASNTLHTRGSLRLTKTWQPDPDRIVRLWVMPGVLKDFGDKTSTTFIWSGQESTLDNKLRETLMGAEAGLEARMGQSIRFTASAGHYQSTASADRTVFGNIGVSVEF
jgi:outer membrane autotransporter protein